MRNRPPVEPTESIPHYQVTAGLIRKGESVLLSKRAKGTHLEGFWEFPGGKQEIGEGLRECLERELKEELGIDTRAGNLILTVEHDYTDKRISLHLFECTWVKGEPRPLQCQEVRWVSWDDLESLTFPPPDRNIIQCLMSRVPHTRHP